MSAPDFTVVQTYLGDTEWGTDDITAALSSEKAAQARRCRVPADTDPWPADLTEALCRRVAANLANRALPLGLQSNVSEVGVGFIKTGGGDREVARLENPHRRLAVG